MKRFLLTLFFCCVCLAMFAQAPQKFTYQAVVRNNSGKLMTDAKVTVRISILQGSESGQVAYEEVHNTQTNDNGLMTILIGNGLVAEGSLISIDWANGPFFLKVETDFGNSGIKGSITSVQQLLSVPYALYAQQSGNAFSGNYEDLSNKPEIPTKVSAFENDAQYLTSYTEQQVISISHDTIFLTGGSFVKLPALPTKVSQLDNDAKYLTSFTETDPTISSWAKAANKPAYNYSEIQNTPNLATVATSGSYNDLSNKPTIPTTTGELTNNSGFITSAAIPTQVSAFTNDAGYLTSYTEQQVISISHDTIFLTGGSFVKLPALPTKVSQLDNDAKYLTSYTETDPTISSWAKAANKPAYNYSEIQNTPNLATVATSGSYNDLSNKPTIPTTTSELTNNSGFITSAAIPTQVSAFTNDAGYLTSYTEQQVISISHDTIFLTGGSFVKLPALPTKVSQLDNDAKYLSSFTETDPTISSWAKAANKPAYNYSEIQNTPNLATVATSGSYNDLSNKPTIPTTTSELTNNSGFITSAAIPTQVSAFVNDSKYITKDSIPTAISAFTNDVGYLSEYQILTISRDTIFLSNGGFVKLPALSQFTNDINFVTEANIQEAANIPSNVSAFVNDVGYLTTETDPTISSWAKAANKPAYNYSEIQNTPNLATVATSGSYNDLNNKPTIPTTTGELTNNSGFITSAAIPTQVSAFVNDSKYITKDSIPMAISAFTNDAGYLTSYTEQQVISISHDTIFLTGGSFVKLPALPTKVSQLDNDAKYLTSYTETDPTISSWAKAANKPAYNYSEIQNTPNLATVATSGSYNDLSNKPALFDGDYNSLSNKPTIPAAANDATLTIQKNDSTVGTFTANAAVNQSINMTVPTTTSELTNNSGFVSNSSCPTVNICDLQAAISDLQNAMITMQATIDTLQNTVLEQKDRIDSLEEEIAGSTPATPFTCGTSTLTDIDGNSYNTVAIGNQCWMKENLKTTHYSDGTAISLGSTISTTVGYWYYPNSSSSKKDTYGLLYNWKAVMGGSASSEANPSGVQGICPTGWHVPSDAEWTQLTDYVSSQSEYQCGGDSTYIAKALASTTGWESNSTTCNVGDDPNSNNATGFSVVPAGRDFVGVEYLMLGYYAPFWSATMVDSSTAYHRSLSYRLNIVRRGMHPKESGYSVRCLKDEEGGGSSTALAPTVSTDSVINITETTATCGGNVTADGGAAVTARGVCWSTNSNPTIADSHTTDGSGVGVFASTLTELTIGTTYYVRAYATNSVGTSYGEQVSFTTNEETYGVPCPGIPTLTDYDNNTYKTVKIGNQCWMKENLKTTHYADGTSIPQGIITEMNSDGCWYYPDADSTNKATYGLLYTSMAVMNYSAPSEANPSGVQGICPTGWHVPSVAEWTQLTDYVSGQSEYQCGGDSAYIAKALASTKGWETYDGTCALGNTPSSNNATGFSALPAGYKGTRACTQFGSNAYYGTTGWGCFLHLIYNDASVYHESNSWTYRGYSVRCLMNEEDTTALDHMVTTDSVTNITATTATCGGNIVVEDGATVTARGVCWSTSPNPTIADNHTTDSTATGSYTSSLTGLTAGTTYYVRAYVTNSDGTSYGEQKSFITPFNCGTFTLTDRDGNTYNTLKIGAQCWMKENLKTTHYSDGTTIASGSSTSTTIGYWYYPNGESSNKATYGLLYNWKALMRNSAPSEANPSGVQGICPTGWHVPSDAEWSQLTGYVSSQSAYQCGGSSANIAKALASTTEWSSHVSICTVGNSPSSNNATAFSAVPAGRYSGNYDSFGAGAYFWSATQNSNYAYYRYLYNNDANVHRDNGNKSYGSSVRCLSNVTFPTALAPTVSTDSVTNITATTATCGGNVTADGGAAVTARGVCWSTNSNPTIADSHTTDSTGTGSFTSSLTGLTASTTYYVRAYATNSAGTSYGEQKSFNTSVPDGYSCGTVTDYDKNTYNTVQIGAQCWIKENLRTTHYSDGISISQGSTTSYDVGYWYYPNDDANNEATYGLLYNWKAVMRNSASSEANPSGVQGICPTGWHVPSDAEWTQLTDYVSGQSTYLCDGSSEYHAKALASTTGWETYDETCAIGNDPSSNNTTGFSLVPAGYYFDGGSLDPNFYNFGDCAFLWSATQGGSMYGPHYRWISFSCGWVNGGGMLESSGLSVRCLRD